MSLPSDDESVDLAVSSLGAAILAAISSRTFLALVTSRFGKLRSRRFAADFVLELVRAPCSGVV